MKLWRGTQPREGLERITHYPLSPHSLYLLAGGKPPCRPTQSRRKASGLLPPWKPLPWGLFSLNPPSPLSPITPNQNQTNWPDPETG